MLININHEQVEAKVLLVLVLRVGGRLGVGENENKAILNSS